MHFHAMNTDVEIAPLDNCAEIASVIYMICYEFQIIDGVIDVFNNVLDDSSVEGWRALQNVSGQSHLLSLNSVNSVSLIGLRMHILHSRCRLGSPMVVKNY